MAICRAKRRDRRFAVMFIDVDHFKKINDERGHLAGDAVLKTVAWRLANCLRAGGGPCRYGGDEFVVLIDDIADESETHGLADRILSAIRAPITIDRTEFHITVSIGITIANELGPSPLGLIGKADQAMYRARAWDETADTRTRFLNAVFDHSTSLLSTEREIEFSAASSDRFVAWALMVGPQQFDQPAAGLGSKRENPTLGNRRHYDGGSSVVPHGRRVVRANDSFQRITIGKSFPAGATGDAIDYHRLSREEEQKASRQAENSEHHQLRHHSQLVRCVAPLKVLRSRNASSPDEGTLRR